MFCKNCGAHMEDSYNVCQNCGTRKGLGVAFCDKCGAVRQAGMAFCQNCGAKMEDTPVASQASTPYSQQTTAQQFQSNASVNNQQYMPAKLYCRNCGKQMMNNQAICTACGVKKGDGNSFCPHCAAPVSNPQQVACTSCGMSLVKAFDFGAYINEFGKNFASVFSGDILGNLLEYGANLLSFLTFVFSFLPCVTFTVSAFGYSESDLHNIYYLSGFGGFLFLVAFLFSIARFVPHVKNFIESNEMFKKFAVFVTPALMVVGFIFTLIGLILGNIGASIGSAAYAGLAKGIVYYNFLGWIFIIFILASVVSAILCFLRKQGVVKF